MCTPHLVAKLRGDSIKMGNLLGQSSLNVVRHQLAVGAGLASGKALLGLLQRSPVVQMYMYFMYR